MARSRRKRRVLVSREQRKEETREALIQAAIEVFAEQGLEAPSLDTLCERAGFTRGAFYVHFETRDDLVVAVMERVTQTLLDALVATGDAPFDLMRTIRLFARAVEAGTYPMPGGMPSYQLLQACARSPRIREHYVAALEQAARRVGVAVRAGQQAGTVRGDLPPEAIANLLIALVLSVQTLSEIGYPFDVRRHCEAVVTLLYGAPDTPRLA